MIKHLLYSLLLILLITSCATPGNSLWGTLPTPTPLGPLLPTRITYPLVATIIPTATATPLMILPPAESATPGIVALQPTLAPINTSGPMLVLKSQSGDTLQIIAKRAGVSPQQIISDIILPAPSALLDPGTLLLIPDVLPAIRTSDGLILPDSEFVYSPTAIDFDIYQYVKDGAGYLSQYSEYLMSNGTTSGAEAVQRIAIDNSINPRLLLAIIEYESNWVRGHPTNFAQDDHPLGFIDYHYKGLFRQMMWASGELSVGYYGWRAGTLTEITFLDGSTLRLSPKLNAATAAMMYFFALTHDYASWQQAVTSFTPLYTEMFGDPWQRASQTDPLFPAKLTQPDLSLPFQPGQVWSFSGGPHSAWERKGALAALDFAPGSTQSGCVASDKWVIAPAPGLVTRTEEGIVILDLDSDGFEQTGWVLLFMHIGAEGKVKTGTFLQQDDLIGHPSCEGGVSTGTHVHIARKYNGEWILAGGVLPFTLGGWVAGEGAEPYKGTLTRQGIVINASTSGSFETRITREKK